MEPLSLCRRDTPVQRLARVSDEVGADIWVKRDDLTGFSLSGNKVRKLEWLLADALAQGARAVVTCGGIQSNHCRATAFAARELGLEPILVLRGDPRGSPDGNLLLDRLAGARLIWVTPDQYRHERDVIMARVAAEHGAAYVIPEGGSNGLGALGFVHAARALQGQPFGTVVCAVGSGGTLAGLACAGLPAQVLGIAVCDDRDTFTARVRAIAADVAGLDPTAVLGELGPDWDVVEGYQGRGYALSRPEELRALAALARTEGVLLDPVYTGKAWFGLLDLLKRGRLDRSRPVLFWHTGGAFGLFGRGEEIEDALREDVPAT